MKIKKGSLFYKYFFSSLILSLIPILIMGIMMYTNIIVKLRSSIEESSMAALNQVNKQIEDRTKELSNITAKLSTNPMFISSYKKISGYDTIELVEKLREIKSNNEFIYDIFFFSNRSDQFFSASGAMKLNSFVKHVSTITEADLFTQYINDTDEPVVLSNVSDNDIVFLYPIPIHSHSPYSVVGFVIEKATLTSMIDDILNNYAGDTYILDKDNNVIVNKDIGIISIEDFNHFFANNDIDTGIKDIKLNKIEYSCMLVKSQRNDWSYFAIMPTKQFMYNVIETRTFILTIISMVLFIVIISSLLVAFRNYKPINDIVLDISAPLGNTAKSNELSYIKSTLNSISQSNQDLKLELDDHKSILTSHLILELLNGRIDNKNTLNKMLKSSHVSMIGDYFNAMVIRLVIYDQNFSVSAKNIITEYISSIPLNQDIKLFAEIYDKNTVVVLLNGKNRGAIDEKSAILSQTIIDFISQNLNLEALIGIGSIYDDPLKVNQSFIDASIAIDYRFQFHNKRIFFIDKMENSQNATYDFTIKEQARLKFSILQGNKKMAKDYLDNIIGEIEKKSYSPFTVKYLCYDLINMVIKTINELHAPHSNKKLDDIMQFNTLDDLHRNLEDIILELCDYVSNQKKTESVQVLDKLVAHIHNNYMNPNYCLEILCEEFNLSISYLSVIIKDYTNQTFTDYLRNLRIKQVKNLLVTSNKKIKEIIHEAGYLDASNFTRTFRQIEGITPGEYRKLYKL